MLYPSRLRRRLLCAGALAPWALAPGPALAADAFAARPLGRTLVAYFSRTGNTRVIAGQIQRARDTDIFEILPAAPYHDDYEQTVAQARRERDDGVKPPLQAGVQAMGDYDTIFLGFPIWGGTAPPVIRTFLASHDLQAKTLIPFITHGGYGPGDSLAVLASHAPGARVLDAELVMQADQERRTLTRVTQWLEKTGAAH